MNAADPFYPMAEIMTRVGNLFWWILQSRSLPHYVTWISYPLFKGPTHFSKVWLSTIFYYNLRYLIGKHNVLNDAPTSMF